jgi:hypothetical protein
MYTAGGDISPSVRLPVEKARINERRGFIQDRGDHKTLWRDCFPEQGNLAMFEMVLAASSSFRLPRTFFLSMVGAAGFEPATT